MSKETCIWIDNHPKGGTILDRNYFWVLCANKTGLAGCMVAKVLSSAFPAMGGCPETYKASIEETEGKGGKRKMAFTPDVMLRHGTQYIVRMAQGVCKCCKYNRGDCGRE